MPTLLGVNTVVGSDSLTVTLTVNQPAGTIVHLFPAAVAVDTTFFDSPVSLSVSDSRSGTWTHTNLGASVGSIQSGGGTSGHRNSLEFGNSCIRTAGAALQSGDTISFMWDTAYPSSITGLAAVYAMSGLTNVAVSQHFLSSPTSNAVRYANGDSYPASSSSPTTLNWTTDLGEHQAPHLAALMICANASYPANSSWTPATGTKFGEHSAGSTLTLALHTASAPANTYIEPGGSWGSSADLLVGNYQFATAVISGFYSWQRL